MSELELKFQVPAAVLASLREELRRHRARSVRMQARYYDTAKGVLARHGVSLRLRKEGSTWVQTLKAEGRSLVDRLEHNVPLHGTRAGVPRLDVRRHDGSEAGFVLRKALAHTEVQSLGERYRTDFRRFTCDLRLRDAVIEAALDEGTISAGDRTVAICELELEHKSGDTQALFDLSRSWCAYGGLWLNTRSKGSRGALLARGADHGPPAKATAPKVHEGMNGAQFVRAVLRATLDQVLANASEIAAGSTDEGHVHQMRVGLRRLRTALRELGSLDPAIEASWEASLAQTFAQLGAARDKVTVARALRPVLEQAKALDVQWDAPVAEIDPVTAVRDANLQETLIGLLAISLSDRGQSDGSHPPLRDYLRERLSGLHFRIVHAGECFAALPLEKQHRARKRLKRLRYLAEFAAPLWKDKAARRYLAQLEPAQEALGRHIDVAVAREKFRAGAGSDEKALLVVRRLEDRLRDTARRGQKALQEVASAPPFWDR